MKNATKTHTYQGIGYMPCTSAESLRDGYRWYRYATHYRTGMSYDERDCARFRTLADCRANAMEICRARAAAILTITAYRDNGANWESVDLSWELTADKLDSMTDGDFSAFDNGEPIRLVAVDANGEQVAERIGVVRDGQFCDE